MNSNKKTISDLKENVAIFESKTGEIFSNYFSKYYPRLVYYINNICRNEELAEDLTTDSFIHALEKIHMYDETKVPFTTWLYTVARNKTLGEIKDVKNLKSVSLDTYIKADDEDACTYADALLDRDSQMAVDIVSNTIVEKKAELVINNINKIPEPYRSIMYKREVQQMSYKDIADELGKDSNINITNNNCQISDTIINIILPQNCCEIYSIIDNITGLEIRNYTLGMSSDKNTQFITNIKIPNSNNIQNINFSINTRIPYNLGTLKSHIRKGRQLITNMSKYDMKQIVSLYGDY